MISKIKQPLILAILLFFGIASNICAQGGWRTIDAPSPLHEVRAVWLTTIGGLDWPHNYAQTPSSIRKQQKELCDILDKLQHANINTILLQTRIRGTVIYDSKGLEPWDGCLSGFPGKSPGYDALAYAIDECHRRGMECHAWVVAIPCGKWNSTGCKALRQKFGKMVLRAGEDGYLDPSDSRTGDYIAQLCGDITRRYDVDGIHLDYIRFPDGIKKLPEANKGRKQITDIVRKVHDAVKREKGWVRLSCSPVGKHDDVARYSSKGWNARRAVLQDAQAWMRDGLMDMEFPMMYFRDNNFYPFAIDWKEKSYGKIICPGLGIYFMHPREKNWPLRDITAELSVMRQYGMGFAMFRSKFLTDNTKGIYDYLCNNFCTYPALHPPVSDNPYPRPLAPNKIRQLTVGDTKYIIWDSGCDNSDGNYLTYNIYASPTYPVDTHKAENIFAMRVHGDVLSFDTSKPMFFAVTAIDRYGNESDVTQEKHDATLPETIKPGWWWVTHPLGR